ncbi:MAG: GDCCVxC domain-containing (seleno)protein [Gemmobacter sp.]
MAGVTLQADIRCPLCAAVTAHAMPDDACQFFLDCPACGAVLRPEPGDCCVFCSYGSMPCPPAQAAGAACCKPVS